jgi:hypothetical protein
MRRIWAHMVCSGAVALAGCATHLPREDGGMAEDAGEDGGGVLDGGTDGGEDLGVWPNSQSAASSDPWIPAHHDQIREMHPKVLALNFVNGRTNAEMEVLIAQIFAGLKEGSRYHGYVDANAPPFLIYELAKAVDLTDHPPPAGWVFKNSTLYPRKPLGSPDTWRFHYGALFSQEFADYYGFADPAHPGRNRPLCELLQLGMVHEIWVYGDGDVPGDVNAAEVLEVKQRYDLQGNPLPGEFDPCAGNGCMDASDIPGCSVSFRIPWVNQNRGPGCLMHSLGHGFEGLAGGFTRRPPPIPYLGANFIHFANFDLQDRHLGPDFQTWYATCGSDCINFTGPNSLTWLDNRGMAGVIPSYDQGCGSVHFPPNARSNYDDQNPFPVLSTCEHYGLHDAPDGGDAQELYTDAKSGLYDPLEPDCEGGWQVYWRQSFPGYHNPAIDQAGGPMKNWWVYEFY